MGCVISIVEKAKVRWSHFVGRDHRVLGADVQNPEEGGVAVPDACRYHAMKQCWPLERPDLPCDVSGPGALEEDSSSSDESGEAAGQ